VVVGDGPNMGQVRALAAGKPNIEVMGFLPNEALADLMARARAFVFAAEEDFGITPVELQACGTPVIAYGAGGAVETVIDDPDPALRTGVLFDEQSVASLSAAVERFERLHAAGGFDPAACRRHAERFGIAAFRLQLRQVVDTALAELKSRSSLQRHPAHRAERTGT
jgi:glycosyltransferase involved in cell wall biosynthesis